MPLISFGPQVCGDLTAGAAREWLLADGRGGYAMGTVSGLRTRRYHALLVVAGNTPASRMVALAGLDPVLTLPSGAQVRLATHEWASGAVSPAGHTLLARFDLADGLPRWRWRVGDVVIERELAMRHGHPCLAAVHRLVSGPPVTLSLDALVTWRDAHGERTAAGPPPDCEPAAGGFTVEGEYRLAGPGWTAAGDWWRGVHHREEAARGLAAEEDLWHAGTFAGPLRAPGDVLEVVAWADDLATEPPPAVEIVASARERHRALAAAGPVDRADHGTDTETETRHRVEPEIAGALSIAADAFVVRTAEGVDVVAGYPWFGAWSRDTMTSYEGLFLDTGRAEEGTELLRGYAATVSEGMLANTADTGELCYNTSDASLWFLHAVERHVTRTGDTDLAAELLPALRQVVDAHLRGTRFGIRVEGDGLLTQGAPGEALTWMDARVDGVPVTPRRGKAVEINALWVNGLAAVAALVRLTRGEPGMIDSVHETASIAFAERFPRPDGTLADLVDSPDGDAGTQVRPNQLLAWSLPYAPLKPEPAVLARVASELLTPIGLRSLSPADPAYRGRHRGSSAERDHAYHQGTVWPWLIGPYALATRRAGVADPALFDGVVAHLAEYGLGSISETADGDAPHSGTGCPFQAWSVATVRNAW